MYSQNDEEKLILSYFGDNQGTVLDIGANDGKTFSNSLALIEKGWKAFLVEPSDNAYEKLRELHKDRMDRVCVCHCAIATQTGFAKFYESGSFDHKGEDVALLSSISREETKRWGDRVSFTETTVKTYTFFDFIALLRMTFCIQNPSFDFISIDAEGMDWEILRQINLKEVGCKLLCVEHNGNVELISNYKSFAAQYGMKEVLYNAENLIFSL